VIPRNLPTVGREARASLAQALADGHRRVAVDIQAFRKTGPALFRPLIPTLPSPWVGIFGTGNAGLGTIEWGKGPWTLFDSGEALDYLDRVPWQAMVLMDASSIENQPMRRFWQVAGDKPVVMVSCWPEAPGVMGLGRGKAKDRAELCEKITMAYYVQAYRFQPLVIYRAYPGPWQLWRVDDTPECLAEQAMPFTAAELRELGRTQPWVDFGERFQAFWNGPSYFREWGR